VVGVCFRNGSYVYQWQYSNDGGSSWNALGTGQSQDRYVDGSTPNFLIRTIVTSGSLSRASSPMQCCSVFFDQISVGISGPSTVPQYTTCEWSAYVNGGVPPYTYSWGPDPGDGDTYAYASTDFNFAVSVYVTDAYGASASAGMGVNVYGSGCGY
jgi:hypothetical protein